MRSDRWGEETGKRQRSSRAVSGVAGRWAAVLTGNINVPKGSWVGDRERSEVTQWQALVSERGGTAGIGDGSETRAMINHCHTSVTYQHERVILILRREKSHLGSMVSMPSPAL